MSGFLQFMLGAALLIGGCGYAYGQWKDRRNASSIDTVKLFKDQIEGMDLKIKNLDADNKKLADEVHELKLAIEEKDKKLKELLEILQGKDPAVLKFIGDFDKGVMPILRRLEKYLDKQSF